jgi:hypothetical protein
MLTGLRVVIRVQSDSLHEKLLQETVLALEVTKRICSVAENTSKQLKVIKTERQDVVEVVLWKEIG